MGRINLTFFQNGGELDPLSANEIDPLSAYELLTLSPYNLLLITYNEAKK